MRSRITTTARPGGKRWLLLTAVPLLVAAPAWACTVSKDTTSVTPTGGPAGSNISASASGGMLANNLSMSLLFADKTALFGVFKSCHHDGVVVGGPTTSANGNVASTSGTIPTTAAKGAGQVCFAQTTDHSVNTTPTSFTVS